MKILYLCPDLGVPVLGRKGASVHVRELVAAFGRAGHNVVLAAQVLNKSPWEQPASVDANVLHLRASSHIADVAAALKALNAMLGAENSLPGELRRILYNQELADNLNRRFDGDPPHFIYERASLYGTAGVVLARELNVPHLLELNAPLAVEQAAYRGTGLGELAAQAERWTLSRADAVLTVSAPLACTCFRMVSIQLCFNPVLQRHPFARVLGWMQARSWDLLAACDRGTASKCCPNWLNGSPSVTGNFNLCWWATAHCARGWRHRSAKGNCWSALSLPEHWRTKRSPPSFASST